MTVSIEPYTSEHADQVVVILQEAFPWYYNDKQTEEELLNFLDPERVVIVATADNRVVGINGAIPHYSVTGWELHPLAVLKEYRGRGVGLALMEKLEIEVATRGGVTIFLGSDDEFGTTSLFGENLYEDTFSKITNIKNTGGHPYPFYEKYGYKIVGVIPDANGIGKPDIWMAKRITNGGNDR